MSRPIEQRFDAEGGLRIAFREWRPAVAARALLVIVPGFNAHSGYYQWTADQLAEAGVVVYAIDLRGRGASDGDRFFVESFADYVADLAHLVALARSRDPDLPVFLLGHSAGGVVACLYALDHQAGLNGLICESFAHALPAPDFALAAIRGLSHLAPHAGVLRLKNQDFSRDPEAVRAMNEDPLIAHETQPTQTLAALVRADEALEAGFPRITLPILILHGTADKAASPSGSQRFFDMAGAADKTLRLYDHAYHDPLHDLDRDQVLADIRSWMAARLPVRSPTPGSFS